MSIKAYVDELENIEAQIKINNQKNAALRKRMKELKTNITQFLQEKDQVGLKYKGKAIILETTEKRLAKKKKEKEESILHVLQELGIANTEEAYKMILEAQKGEPVETHNVKIKKISNN